MTTTRKRTRGTKAAGKAASTTTATTTTGSAAPSPLDLLERARKDRALAERARKAARHAPTVESAEQLRLHAAHLRAAAGALERRVVATRRRPAAEGL